MIATQNINFRIDREGISVCVSMDVSDIDKYPFDKMALLARYIKTDIIDNITCEEGLMEREEDDVL